MAACLSTTDLARNSCGKGSQGGYILFTLLVVGTLIICIAMSAFLGIKGSMKAAGSNRVRGNAFNIAEAGKEHALSILRLDSMLLKPTKDSMVLSAVSFGEGSYTVSCSTNSKTDTVFVRSTGSMGAQAVSIEAACYRYTVLAKMAYTSTAAITVKSDIKALGNVTIDGNDWDSTNTAIVGPGVYGISTCGDDSVDASAQVYGRGFIDSTKSKKTGAVPIDSVVLDNLNPAGYPGTPEAVLGLAAGALDTFKTHSFPATPFHGIVYVDSAGIKNSFDFRGSSGIFIYHSAGYSSILKNIKGSFKGILICDQIDHINDTTRVLGSIATLSNDPFGNVFGNGKAFIRYSSQILQNLQNYMGKLPVFVDVVSWKEL
jgi:hypothetical protein